MTQRPQAKYSARVLITTLFLVTTTHGQDAQVYKTTLRPHWFAENTQFWYRNDLAGGAREFILVETEQGRRAPAFDHARVAQKFSDLLDDPVDANHLPVTSLAFGETPSTVDLIGPESAWRLDLDGYTLRPLDDAEVTRKGLPFTRRIRPSRRTGAETFITFVNQLETEIRLFWIDNEGQRLDYGRVKAGARRRQHTYAGHVWLVTDPNEETLAVYEAVAESGQALIDGSEPTERPGRRRGRGEGRPSSLSPNGQWTPFVRDHNLWLRHAETGKERQLSNDGTADDGYHRDVSRARLIGMRYEAADAPAEEATVFWSPDSRHVVALRTTQVPERRVYMVESAPDDQLQPKLHSYPYLKAGDPIPQSMPHLFRVVDQQEIAIDATQFANPWSIGRYEWASDSSQFTFLFNQRGHQVMRVIAVEAESGAVRVSVDEACDSFFDYSNKTHMERLSDSNELIWMSERSGWNHLYLYDTTTGQIKNAITQGEWVVRRVDRVDREQRQVWFQAVGVYPQQDPYFVHHCRIDLDGSNRVVLTKGDGTHTLQWSPDRQYVIDTYSRVDLPPIHELRKTEDGSLLCLLEKADAGALLAEGRLLPERFVAKGRDGVTDIYGIIHRPKQFDPSRSYAVIESIYAGPHGAHVPKSFRASYGQWRLTDLGFIVVQIDGMGTNWRSKAFHDVCWQNLGDAGFPDRVLWIKAAAEKYSYMDLDRVGIYGGSAGGQNSLGALLTHGDFYKVGVTDCGCHDNRMDKIWWNEQWMGWPLGPHYEAQSNVTLAKHLQGKVLLIVGELDRNVDPASTMQVVKALIEADKDFDMLVVPGAGHGASGTAYGRRRLQDYFVRHLLNGKASQQRQVVQSR